MPERPKPRPLRPNSIVVVEVVEEYTDDEPTPHNVSAQQTIIEEWLDPSQKHQPSLESIMSSSPVPPSPVPPASPVPPPSRPPEQKGWNLVGVGVGSFVAIGLVIMLMVGKMPDSSIETIEPAQMAVVFETEQNDLEDGGVVAEVPVTTEVQTEPIATAEPTTPEVKAEPIATAEPVKVESEPVKAETAPITSLVVSAMGTKPACVSNCIWGDLTPTGFPKTANGTRTITCGTDSWLASQWIKIEKGDQKNCYTVSNLVEDPSGP